MTVVVTAKVDIAADSALEDAAVAGPVRDYCSRMPHLGLLGWARRADDLWEVAVGQRQLGVLAPEVHFPQEYLEVETYTARMPRRFASFHFFEAVNAGFVAGTDFGWVLRIQGLQEWAWMKDQLFANL